MDTAKRIVLAAATAFVSINIWTGVPLLALWVSAQFVGETALSMKAAAMVLLVLALMVFAMALLLTWLNNTYEELTRRSHGERRSPWLRGKGSEGEVGDAESSGITTLERIVIISVYVAVIALLLWFFFIAGSPLPQ